MTKLNGRQSYKKNLFEFKKPKLTVDSLWFQSIKLYETYQKWEFGL